MSSALCPAIDHAVDRSRYRETIAASKRRFELICLIFGLAGCVAAHYRVYQWFYDDIGRACTGENSWNNGEMRTSLSRDITEVRLFLFPGCAITRNSIKTLTFPARCRCAARIAYRFTITYSGTYRTFISALDVNGIRDTLDIPNLRNVLKTSWIFIKPLSILCTFSLTLSLEEIAVCGECSWRKFRCERCDACPAA